MIGATGRCTISLLQRIEVRSHERQLARANHFGSQRKPRRSWFCHQTVVPLKVLVVEDEMMLRMRAVDIRCAHRTEQARAAYLRDAPARRGTDRACGAGRGIRRLARAPDRGKRLREGAERSEAPRGGDGDPGASAGALASNPISVVGKTDDGQYRYGYVFTTTERRERGAARRVPIEPSSTIHARHFASSIERLSPALQMDNYPKFHNEVGVPIVRIGCREFKCIGDKPPQDHPHIYLKIGDTGEIVCPYCSTLFRFDPSLGANEADPADCAYGDP
jgi:uncharacterized Zn-finger protein